jgi:hypothetical protein
MAISRAQLLKELLPGLNALFGMEYDKYENEHAEIYETETQSVALRKRSNFQALVLHQLSLKVQRFLTTTRKSPSLPVTTTKQWQWASL